MSRKALVILLLVVSLLLSSCVYTADDLKSQYDEGFYEGFQEGYEDGYEDGVSAGYYEGWDLGYEFAYDEAAHDYEDNFESAWEDWLLLAYDITEEELCILLGIQTDAPKPTASPSPSPSPTPTISPSPTPSPTPTISPSPTPSPTPTASPSPAPTAISLGARGDDVVKLQERLNALGFSCGAADGVFGQKTAAAISEFQKAARLTVTGNADQETLAALFAKTAPSATPAPTVKSTVSPAAQKLFSQLLNPSSKQTSTPRPTATPKPQVKYIGNKNTYKFHYTWCSSVDLMKESNKVFAYSRSDLTSRGYVPCKRCDP